MFLARRACRQHRAATKKMIRTGTKGKPGELDRSPVRQPPSPLFGRDAWNVIPIPNRDRARNSEADGDESQRPPAHGLSCSLSLGERARVRAEILHPVSVYKPRETHM